MTLDNVLIAALRQRLNNLKKYDPILNDVKLKEYREFVFLVQRQIEDIMCLILWFDALGLDRKDNPVAGAFAQVSLSHITNEMDCGELIRACVSKDLIKIKGAQNAFEQVSRYRNYFAHASGRIDILKKLVSNPKQEQEFLVTLNTAVNAAIQLYEGFDTKNDSKALQKALIRRELNKQRKS